VGAATPSLSGETSQLRSLARQIRRGDCVLVLGPGAAMAPDQSPEVPLSVELSRQLAEDRRLLHAEGLDPRDLRHVSQLLHEATHRISEIQDTVVEFYAQYAGQTTAFHRNIAALPFKLCLTTTPDDFLFNALVEAGKQPVRQFFNFRGSRPVETIAQPTVDRPLVYHLYGHPADPDSLVITENDLIDFLVSVVKDTPPLAALVRSELAKQTTTCLFLDLGFKNWYLRALLRVLHLLENRESSIAVEDADFFRHSEEHQAILYFSAAAKAIEFREDSLDQFAARLRQAHDAIAAPSVPAAPVTSPSAPRAFLSYAREDRVAVDRLADSLRAAGIAVWQDHQNLRAGDRWEKALVQVIQKQVDYVIVVQSATLARSVSSYVGSEVADALRRNKKMLWNLRFLLPVRLDNAPVLDELQDLHNIDVSTDTGVQALIVAIREDWQRRAERQA
jgi:hypothetical protein